MKSTATSTWFAQVALLVAVSAGWSDARAYGNPNDGNCGFDAAHLRCAFFVLSGHTYTNPLGTTLAPDSLTYSNFTNLGTLNNFGYIWSAGIFDNFGFYNGTGATFNNRANPQGLPRSTLELSHGWNLGTIDNEGVVRINFIQGGSYPIIGGLDNGSTGTIQNKGSLVNRGQLSNANLIENFSNATMLSAPNPAAPPPYAVNIDNMASATLRNRGYFSNGSTLSTITNSGRLENLGGGTGFSDGQLDNFGTIQNQGSGTIVGTIVNTGTLTNYYKLFNETLAVLYNNNTLVNNGTLNNSSNMAFPSTGTPLGVGLINDFGGVLTNNAGAQLSNTGTLTNYDTLANAGTLTNSGTITNHGAINNAGIFNVSASGIVTGSGTFAQSAGTTQMDGYLSQSSVTVNGGTFNLTGSMNANVSNAGTFNVAGTGTITITGNLTNLPGGSIKVTGNGPYNSATLNGTRVVYTGMFFNNGGYVSDPATNVFGGGLTVGSSGYLVGGAQDEFVMQGDFLNNSTQNTLWHTELSKIIFEGGGAHHVNFGSADNGASGFADNFAWGSLSIDPNDSLDVSGTIYARLLSLGSIGQLSGGGTIYYDPTLAGNAYLNGANYDLDGGGHLLAVAAVPEPESYAPMLAGLGLIGLILRRTSNRKRAARTRETHVAV